MKMAPFAHRVPRLVILLAAVASLCLVPPDLLAKGPNLCVWRHLFHIAACPSCGSTRALCAFFHGHFRAALAYNRNVVVTAPVLLGLLLQDSAAFLKRFRAPARRQGSGNPSV
jgi:Protein of unknown function (DUF2752)